MDRYWEANAITSPPPAPDRTAGGYPTDGNPTTATPPTTPGAWWYHAITEEIRNAIIKLGGTPDFTQVDQLANAIVASVTKAISGVTANLARVAYSGSYNDLGNRPVIPAAQVNADWTAVGGIAAILNKPAIPAAQVNSDWNASGGVAAILNRPDVWTKATLQPMTLGGPGNVILVGNSLSAGQTIDNPKVRPNGPTLTGTWMCCGQFSSGADILSLCVRVA